MPVVGFTARACGALKVAAVPVPSALPAVPAVPAKVVTTFGARPGSVEYWKEASVLVPWGLTVPLSVAPVAVTFVAASVVTVASRVRSSSASSRGRPKPREDPRRRRPARGDVPS